MTATLRIVLDQLATETDPELAMVSRELGRALVATAPAGCEVAAIVPGGTDAEAIGRAVPGLADIHRAPMSRRELAASWQLGIAPGIGGGMIHAPSLLGPLVKHDRENDNDQTVVTVWDLRAWERPETLSKAQVAWHKAMLKRAQRRADAVVVPTHAMAARLGELGKFGGRIRVIAGAAPRGLAVPSDAVGRRRTLDVPEGTIVVAGESDASHGFAAIAAAKLDLPVVVLDVAEGDEPAVVDAAVAAGLHETHVHARGRLDDHDRAAVFDGALALVAPSTAAGFPWRVLEALTLGVPVVAAASADHDEIIGEGGVTAPDAEGMGAALAAALSSSAALDRMAVLAGDRGKVFSWREHADAVWELHAEL